MHWLRRSPCAQHHHVQSAEYSNVKLEMRRACDILVGLFSTVYRIERRMINNTARMSCSQRQTYSMDGPMYPTNRELMVDDYERIAPLMTGVHRHMKRKCHRRVVIRCPQLPQ